MSMFDAPNPPDPQNALAFGAQTAGLQQNLNTGNATASQRGSMVDQSNPYGSVTYSQTGTGPNGVPIYSANVNLNQQQQDLFNTLQNTKGAAGAAGNSLITGANYGSTSPTDAIGGYTKGLTSDFLKTQGDYYSPIFNQQRDRLDTQLRNQGLAPGMHAYDAAMQGIERNQGDVISKALSDFEPQAYNQASQLYQMPYTLGKDMAEFGAAGNPTSSLVQTPQLNIANPDLTGATAVGQKAQTDQYNAQMGQYQNMMSGLFGIPSALLGGWAKGGGLDNLLGSSTSTLFL